MCVCVYEQELLVIAEPEGKASNLDMCVCLYACICIFVGFTS